MMKRLTIYLKNVEKINNKIYNTVSHIINDTKEIPHFLDMYGGEKKILKHQISNVR